MFATTVVCAQGLPTWWTSMPGLARLESNFVQQSESEVFGSLQRHGTIQLAKGGRIRVAYSTGLLVVSDGTSMIQYDPAARTAQRFNLRSAASDMPLLNVLLDLKALGSAYRIVAAESDHVKLEPRRPGLPKVELEGRGGFLHFVSWADSTGAKQTLELKNPHVPAAAFPASVFTFQAPSGTRWLAK
jgi:outer membrane lipoprotein-sorting protein